MKKEDIIFLATNYSSFFPKFISSYVQSRMQVSKTLQKKKTLLSLAQKKLRWCDLNELKQKSTNFVNKFFSDVIELHLHSLQRSSENRENFPRSLSIASSSLMAFATRLCRTMMTAITWLCVCFYPSWSLWFDVKRKFNPLCRLYSPDRVKFSKIFIFSIIFHSWTFRSVTAIAS